MAEAGTEEGVQVSRSWEAMPAAVQDHVLEVSQDISATGPDGEPSACADAVVANNVGQAADVRTTEEDDEGGKEVDIAGGGPVAATVIAFPEPVSSDIEVVAEPPAPVDTPGSSEVVEDNVSPLSVDSATLAHDMTHSARNADQVPHGEPVEVSVVQPRDYRSVHGRMN